MSILEILKSEDYQGIEEFCTKRYQRNLEFFHKDYPSLFTSLQQEAKEYQLLIDKSGINILNFQTNSLMYPLQEGKSLMVQTHENCAYNPPVNDKWERYWGDDLAFMDSKFPLSSKWVNKIIDFGFKEGALKDIYHLPSDFLPSLTLFGLGGGIFLQILVENYATIHSFIIFEESLDLFRIACFFVDFPTLFSKTQFRSGFIFIESFIKRDYVQHYFLQRRISSSVIRFELTLYQTPKNQSARRIVKELHLQNLRGWGTFEDEMRGVRNKKSFPIEKILIEPKRINAPICVVANGPSLDFLIPFIKKNQNKMIIFSCGTALKPLRHYGIVPDFQVEIERHDYLDEVLKEAPLGDVPLLCATVLDKKAKALAKEIYLFERDGASAADLNEPSFKVKFTAPLVGNAGAALASYLGSDVILCGLDCGYKKGARKHAQNSYYGEEDYEIPQDAYEVAGNLSEGIYSDALYSLSRTSLEEAFGALKPHNILNLNDGALIAGARPTRAEEFDLKAINKAQELKNLKSLFKNPQEENFYHKESSVYLFEAVALKNRIGDLFKAKIEDKAELFVQVDRIYEEIAKVGKSNSFLAILFGGSLSHFLYAIILVSLHYPTNQIQNIWLEAEKLYNEGFESMLEDFRKAILGEK